jgi:hypothetical protein
MATFSNFINFAKPAVWSHTYSRKHGRWIEENRDLDDDDDAFSLLSLCYKAKDYN